MELFSSMDSRALYALANRVIPPDADSPGGAEGGGVTHLLRELSPGGALARELDTCRAFLSYLNERAGGDFAAGSEAEQDALLKKLEGEPATLPPFRRMAEWITEGYYAGPSGWKLVGFTPARERTV